MEAELNARLEGNLPTIRIMDRDYLIDWRIKELRMKDDPSRVLSLKAMDMDQEGEHYLCFYHTVARTNVQVTDTLTELPKDVVMLKIPFELKLDPVGVAREFGLSDNDFLKQYPIQRNLQATVVSLKETGLPRLVKENNQRMRQDSRRKPRIK